MFKKYGFMDKIDIYEILKLHETGYVFVEFIRTQMQTFTSFRNREMIFISVLIS